MTEKEKKILEELDTATQDVEVPDSLLPEQIYRKIQETETVKKTSVRKRGKRILTRAVLPLAACLALVLVAVQVMDGPRTDTWYTSSGSGDSETHSQAVSPEDYSEIYACLEASAEETATSSDGGMVFLKESAADSAASSDMGAARSGTESYSGTNVRTEGVGEADIVKTDGTRLYVLRENQQEISIVDVSGTVMKEAGRIQLEEGVTAREFYVQDSSLFVLGNREKAVSFSSGYEDYENETVCVTYDISDVSAPVETDTLVQSGYYITSRFADGFLYLFSQFDVGYEMSSSNLDSYIPQVRGNYLAAGEILMPDEHASQYLVVTSVNTEKPGEPVDKKAVLSNYGECYVGSDSIYIYESKYVPGPAGNGTNRTSILRLPYGKGAFGEGARGEVNGTVHDSFCIDEYDGYLRVVTTFSGTGSETSAVYILNQDMEITGKIEDLARGESVYSARLMGDTGYFVTYEQTDPLFSVDLSSPSKPQIIGSLKIPGFSDYLHPYGEGLLIGIGMDTDPETGITEGVKISMFDISSPEDVREVASYTIEDTYYTDVSSDYKAVLIDTEKNLIGFSASGDQEHYYVFQYKEGEGFVLAMDEEVNGGGWQTTRGVYIEDTLYVVKGNAVESYDMKNYQKIDDILL